METDKIDMAENIFKMVKDLGPDVKLDLINKIKESLKDSDKTDDSWKNLFGAWKSEESAEEIIEGIRANRYTKRDIEDL
ncbi:hypothetical protein KIH41_12835 [Litoribacter ruber]|uniref:Uncharacterized protein n=1 Tax=Litoribacter ruber TaxID=702568 RepID=A0AAP2CHE8_9BACT|nr:MULTISPECIES: hypothetical protein [Litoribacter]MBS9523649.1 hypothetical protein [Litoribacter alkaliphilus]MBT0812163.1 hypothetical protein [Litoribacter ruber]